MKINYNFVKTNWNGYMEAFSYTRWYEPIMYYPMQIVYAVMLIIPYWGGQFLMSIVNDREMIEIEDRNTQKPKKVKE